MQEQGLISVVIVNYNGRSMLENCLQSVQSQTYRKNEIIVVDNGSYDDSIVFIRKRFPEITIVEMGFNAGFSAANNRGIGLAKGEFIFLLNNDTVLDACCLQSFISALQILPPTVGMCSGKVLSFYERRIIDNTGHLIYPDGLNRGRGRLEYDQGQYDQSTAVAFPSGCAGLYRRTLLNCIGLLDERFFLYGEDADLGFRALLAGWKCAYVPLAVIYHMYSASSGSYSSQKAFFVERNRIWLMWKNFPLWLIILSPYFTMKRLCFNLISMLSGRGAAGKYTKEHSASSLILIFLTSWYDAVRGLPYILRERRQVQRRRCVSDAEIWSWFRCYGISVHELTLKE